MSRTTILHHQLAAGIFLLFAWSINAFETSQHESKKCTIGMLDLSDPVFGMPPCNPEQKIVADDKGQIRTCTKPPCQQHGSHNISHFAGPYWLQQYLRSSDHYNEDISSADAVFVYDYCYVQWMIGDIHANDGLFPHLDVYKGYQRLTRLRRFGKADGEDFVFFEPHPLSGIYSQFCKDFSRSLHLVVEAPIRYNCPADEGRRNFLVVPYSSPEFVEDGNVAEVERDIDLFFQGHCSDHLLALAIRKFTAEYLEGLHAPGVQVACDKSNSHKELRGTLRRSKFCLVIAGETASTRRLTDVMLAGCIPVFLGPPWHSLPLAQWVDYSSFAIFVELAAYRDMELATPAVAIQQPTPGKRAKSVYDHSWWILDADVSKLFQTIGNVSELLPMLKGMPAEEVASKQANARKYASYFRYRRTAAEELDPSIRQPTATDAILEAVCEHAKHVGTRYKAPRASGSSMKLAIFSFFQRLFGRSSIA